MTTLARRRWPAPLGALLAASCFVATAAAQPAAAPARAASTPPIAYPTVAAALQDLNARDGNGTVVTHADGWTIVNEPQAAAQWSFAPAGHAAYPAVVRRVIRRGPGREVAVETELLCEAPAAACDGLREEFAKLNERITQAARARAGGAKPAP